MDAFDERALWSHLHICLKQLFAIIVWCNAPTGGGEDDVSVLMKQLREVFVAYSIHKGQSA